MIVADVVAGGMTAAKIMAMAVTRAEEGEGDQRAADDGGEQIE